MTENKKKGAAPEGGLARPAEPVTASEPGQKPCLCKIPSITDHVADLNAEIAFVGQAWICAFTGLRKSKPFGTQAVDAKSVSGRTTFHWDVKWLDVWTELVVSGVTATKSDEATWKERICATMNPSIVSYIHRTLSPEGSPKTNYWFNWKDNQLTVELYIGKP
ncbi:Hypothetical protein POVN_LOCUS716 [uncultured virus]|nr:Hypothetical protein POVN_LOCUS716 [uncultured virus]